ncbi:hypothetical protein M406DRAFT_89361 [Cryphonectria parasitica EP155]|uniref:Phosphoglycerate mutase n=1 Tax=Cryphonectria parasitica (strain ATCC 38755 / EP155) TaxID=660469 RepID=A0A9P4Y4X0_CRYP1|nr:uncharacterized protein M406DRAFT_89361 [Cryphonectria parasitica EP155]KAF3766586.1 hypothetical protein M406DRAFT_89361 [Cryphonectria parasitica EP155]
MALRVFLVRHGESVDNVAGLYAGSRDSPLTSHGVLQAQRLGAHLAARSATIGPVNYIFASNLRRAVKTAEAIAEAQHGVQGVNRVFEVVQVPMLREKDFGSEEGMRFGTRGAQKTATSSASASAAAAAAWVETESQQSMSDRINRFVDDSFVQTAIQATVDEQPGSIAIVAHGIILNVLLRCLLTRFGPEEIPRLARPGTAPWRSEWLAAWSNTGYLELELRIPSPAGADLATPEIQLFVKSVNSVDHLQGLKKTRGGIGSAGFDEKQRTMESFFSRSTGK